ncbi:FAD binding domain-containing protein [Candidatus Riflebacteria bacterium]
MQDFEIILVKSSLENGLIFLYQYANDSKVIAGGTDLVPRLQHGNKVKPFLVDFSEIRSLCGIIKKNNFVRMGALTAIRDVIYSDLINRECPLLVQAGRSIKNRQIINRATIGGAVSTSSPFSDIISALICYDAKVAVISKTSKRKIELKEMIVGHNKNILQPFEMVGYIEIEILPTPQKNYYLKVGQHNDSSVRKMNLAVNLLMAADGETVEQARIAPGNVFTRPKRLASLEDLLVGKKFSSELLDEASELVKKSVTQVFYPLDTIEAKQKLLSGMTYQALYEVFQRGLDNVN